MFTCEICGKLVTKCWFGFFDVRRHCGACCTPPRPEEGPFIKVNHDPGDEQRQEA